MAEQRLLFVCLGNICRSPAAEGVFLHLIAQADLEAQIAERDHLDSTRAVAPLTQAEDALELITDGMAIDAVIQRLVDLFRERVPHDAWPDPN